MKRTASSVTEAEGAQLRSSAARHEQPSEETRGSSEAEEASSHSSRSDEDVDEDSQYNQLCEYCQCRLSEDVHIFIYSKRDDTTGAEMVLCTAPKPQLRTTIAVSIASCRF